jgi:hypothetical protein
MNPPSPKTSDERAAEAANEYASHQSQEYRINTGHCAELGFLAGIDWARQNPSDEVKALVDAIECGLHHMPADGDPFDTFKNTASHAIEAYRATLKEGEK